MSVFVIVCYRPKAGRESDLLQAVTDHIPVLRKEGLVTDRPPYVMRAADGTIVEVFEWKSQAAIDSAHANPSVLALWERFQASCTYEPIASVAEAAQLFSPFQPVEL